MESMKTINPIINSLFQIDYFVIDQWDQWNYEWRFLIPFAMETKYEWNRWKHQSVPFAGTLYPSNEGNPCVLMDFG